VGSCHGQCDIGIHARARSIPKKIQGAREILEEDGGRNSEMYLFTYTPPKRESLHASVEEERRK